MANMRPLDPRLEPIEVAAFAAVMQASKQIGERWTEITGQQEMPLKSNWAIRVEELAFYLHLVSRLAFMVGGDELRARIQDYLTIRMVNELVDCSFDSSHVDPRRKGELAGKMKMEVLEVINDAEMEFAECKTVLETPAIYSTTSGAALVPDDADVIGRLAKRIAEDTGQVDTKHFRELIWGVNITACNDLQIIREVDTAIQSIRN